MLTTTQALGTNDLRTRKTSSPKATMMEQKLLQEARNFDQKALAVIYDQYSPQLYRYAMRLTGDSILAEDFVADTFTRFLKSLKSKSGPQQNLKAYLFRITHNLITDYYRQKPKADVPIEDEITSDNDKQPRYRVEEKLQNERTRNALLQLTEEQGQVIALRFLEGLEIEEVSTIMNKPSGAIKSLQHRALVNLRKLLDPGEDNYD